MSIPVRRFTKFWQRLLVSIGLVLVLSVGQPFGFSHSLMAQSSVDASQLLQQGREQYQQGTFSQAIALWQQAAIAYQAQGDQANQALALSYLSLAYQQLGEWSQAQTAIVTSLDLVRSVESRENASLNHQLILAQGLNTQGSLQFAQGKTEAALATWQQATAIYTQLGDEQRRIGSLINQAQAQQALGLFVRARQTLDDVERSLQNQPTSQLKALGLRSLGNVLLLVGSRVDAQRILQQSLKLTQQLQLPHEVSATLISLGNAARSQSNPDSALAFYRQAATTTELSLTRVQAALNQLSLLLERGRTTEAQTLLPELQSQIEHLPVNRAALYSQINFARSLIQLGNNLPTTQKAAQMLANAVQQAKGLGDRRAESYAIGYLGYVYEQNQQWAEAQRLTEQALLIAQAMNAPDIVYQWQWQLGRLLKAQGQTTAAIQTYEAAFKTLQSVRRNLLATSSDLQFSFRESVEPVYRELVDLLLQQSEGEYQAATPQRHLKQARQIIESLQLAELDNFFRSACLEGQTVELDTVDQTDAAVIYPIILHDRIAVIISIPGQPLRQYVAPVAQQAVALTLNQFRQSLEKPITTPESKALGQRIYDWLVRPIDAELQHHAIKTLVFVLDGELRNIPIAALYDGNQYLIEHYSIALAPGLQLLNPKPLQQQGLQTLAAGLTEERHGFSALPNVGSELQEIQSEVSSQVLLNQAFTSTALQQQINAASFSIVHLATHGQFSSNAEETFVLAWDKPIRVQELSQLLRQREDVREDAIELLVLSACETATGDKRAALGLAGVAVQAGARSTLASLWSLDDQSGAQLIAQFYHQLVNNKVSKAEALRQAQLQLLHNSNFRHPRYWAPYVLLGNWL
ncbi:CHAT domain-containing protein [Pantanalinema sp. GBBB05]|uniref:CHAT domain-containing protein n=1 Tax=Pantanalinema sp. GBBB05 TaxID=2604139 RepID=UPI001D48F8FB|nr:CHAT domain-containing protein [Pantanalinema sp. GBBB05]